MKTSHPKKTKQNLQIPKIGCEEGPLAPTLIVISSDEELERSMCKLEENISLEMDSD